MQKRTAYLPSRHSDKRLFWQRHIRQQARGKLTQRSYCQRHEIGYASFARWRRLLQPERLSESPSAFIPVQLQLAAKESSNPDFQSTADALTLVLPNGLRIEGVSIANLDLVATLVSRL